MRTGCFAGATCSSLSCATFIPSRQSEALRSLSMHHSTAPAVRAIMGRISTNTATSYLITGEFVVTLAACTSVAAPLSPRVMYAIFRLVFSCTWGRSTPSRLFPHGLDLVSPLPSIFSPLPPAQGPRTITSALGTSPPPPTASLSQAWSLVNPSRNIWPPPSRARTLPGENRRENCLCVGIAPFLPWW